MLVAQTGAHTRAATPGHTATQRMRGPHCASIVQARYADTAGHATPPIVSHVGGRPIGRQAGEPSHTRRTHEPETQSEFVAQGTHAVDPGQSVG